MILNQFYYTKLDVLTKILVLGPKIQIINKKRERKKAPWELRLDLKEIVTLFD